MNIDQKTLQILDIDHSFVIETQIMSLSVYNRRQYIIINPREDEWNYKLLSVFLNSLDKWFADPKNGCRKRSKNDGTSYFFFKFISSTEEWHELILNIFPSSIIVKVSIEMLDSEQWTLEKVKKGKIQKSCIVDVSKSTSKALLRNSPLLYYSELQFTNLKME